MDGWTGSLNFVLTDSHFLLPFSKKAGSISRRSFSSSFSLCLLLLLSLLPAVFCSLGNMLLKFRYIRVCCKREGLFLLFSDFALHIHLVAKHKDNPELAGFFFQTFSGSLAPICECCFYTNHRLKFRPRFDSYPFGLVSILL